MSLLPENMNQLEADMMSKCLEFSQVLVNQRQAFNLSFTIGIHSFSLDTRGSTTKVVERKKLSPSQMRRNLKRRGNFLKRKSEAQYSEETNVNESENKVNSVKKHKCSICDRTFTTKNGLSILKGKAHETENLRTSSPNEPSLKASPPKEALREEQCVCCGDLMSPQHQCETPHQPEANQLDYTCGLDCDMCEETFRTEDDLGRHRACVHMRCACSACDNTDKRPLDFHRCYN